MIKNKKIRMGFIFIAMSSVNYGAYCSVSQDDLNVLEIEELTLPASLELHAAELIKLRKNIKEKIEDKNFDGINALEKKLRGEYMQAATTASEIVNKDTLEISTDDIAVTLTLESVLMDYEREEVKKTITRDHTQAASGAGLEEDITFVTQKEREPDCYKIVLSIDGGGVRGIIPSYWLQMMKDANGGHSVRTYFDYAAGTSIGGITALGLNTELTEEDFVKLFTEHGQEIFPASSGAFSKLYRTFNFYCRRPIYSSTGLENLLERKFGDKTLSESVIPVLVPTVDITRRNRHSKLYFFESEDARKTPNDNFYYRDVARATSAAPTYFPAARIKSEADISMLAIDGGVFMNNPAREAYRKAKRMFGDQKVAVFSLGTGSYQWANPVPISAGSISYASPLIEHMMQYQSHNAHIQMLNEVRDNDANYYRLQVPLEADIKLDDASSDNLDDMITWSSTDFYKDKINEIVRFLGENSLRKNDL